MILNGVNLDETALADLCSRHRLAELHVFGSILRDDFRSDSDVDFIIRVREGERMTFSERLDIMDELTNLTGRRVDLVLDSELNSPRANPIRRRHIRDTMVRIHAA
jgi:predicted nucleotidyltransferase